MENRFFITEVYIPSGCRTMEHNLAAVPRKYVDHILSYDAMLRLADEVAQTQAQLLNENKKMYNVAEILALKASDTESATLIIR